MPNYTIPELIQIGLPILMPMLVDAAQKRTTVTYRDVRNRIETQAGGRFSRLADEQMGHVAGALMNEIQGHFNYVDAPPINSLVLNKIKKLPGIGVEDYIHKYFPRLRYSTLTDVEKRQAIALVHEEVWNYSRWPEISKNVFGIQAGGVRVCFPQGDEDGKAARNGYRGPAESEEHRRLKFFVKENPDRFGAPRNSVAQVEKPLESGDEIDVWFGKSGEQLAIEVKSIRSNDLDLRRGIFQCVKYRAVLKAQCKYNYASPEIRAKLVSERPLPSQSASAARRLGIEVQVIRPLRR